MRDAFWPLVDAFEAAGNEAKKKKILVALRTAAQEAVLPEELAQGCDLIFGLTKQIADPSARSTHQKEIFVLLSNEASSVESAGARAFLSGTLSLLAKQAACPENKSIYVVKAKQLIAAVLIGLSCLQPLYCQIKTREPTDLANKSKKTVKILTFW